MSYPVEELQARAAAASVDSNAETLPVERLGGGDFNNIYGVDDLAVKIPKVKASNPTGSVEAGDLLCYRLQNEEGLSTDGIVKIETIRDDSTGHYVVMERCRGGELENMERETGAKLLAEGGALGLMNSLDGIHRRGCAHRDIKPANIFCTAKKEGKAKIGDFGFLARCGDGYHRPGIDNMCGTLCYVPPEKFIAFYLERDDLPFNEKRADRWALGATFFEVLSGRHFDDFLGGLYEDRYGECDFEQAMTKLFLDQDGFRKYFRDAMLAELRGVGVQPLMRAMVGELLNPDPRLALGIEKILEVIKSVGKESEHREEYELMQGTGGRIVAEEAKRKERGEIEGKKKIEGEKKREKEREEIEGKKKMAENDRKRREMEMKRINEDKEKRKYAKQKKEEERIREVKKDRDIMNAEKNRVKEEERKALEEKREKIRGEKNRNRREEGTKKREEKFALGLGGRLPAKVNYGAALKKMSGARVVPQRETPVAQSIPSVEGKTGRGFGFGIGSSKEKR